MRGCLTCCGNARCIGSAENNHITAELKLRTGRNEYMPPSHESPTMSNAVCIAAGVAFWWIYFGVECFLNGELRGGLSMPFFAWFQELGWNLPFVGETARMEFTCGDKARADKLPGRWHFVLTNVLLPLFPWIIYRTAFA